MALPPPPQQDLSTDGLNWRRWFSKAYRQITTTIPALITAGDNLRVLKAGDTMTGTLTMDTADILGDGTTIWVEGYTYGGGPDAAPGPYVAEGEGTRLLFIQDSGMYGAFRAGYVSGTQWDISKIGAESAAFGEDTQASGYCDFACGLKNTISSTGGQSFAAGSSNSIIGNQRQGAIFGAGNTISGNGIGNFVAGLGNIASSFYGVALGQNNAVGGGSGAVALGTINTATGGGAVAIGASCQATQSAAVSIGSLNSVSATNAVAIGTSLTIDTTASTAVGRGLNSNGFSAVTMLGYAGGTAFLATANNTFYVLGGTTTPLIDLNSTAGIIRTNLTIAGTLTSQGRVEAVTSKTANYPVVATDENIICDSSAGAFTITLPASPATGRVYTVIQEVAGFNLTVDGNGNNINGSATIVMNTAYLSYTFLFNGTNWSIK